MTQFDPDNAPVVEHQLRDLMEGIGASEDHEDVRNVFRAAGISEATIDMVFERIIPTSDWSRDNLEEPEPKSLGPIRDCTTCKHWALSTVVEPCSACSAYKPLHYTHWEPEHGPI